MTERLDLLTLRVVIAVAESGSISAGSDRLQLAVAAASARISAMEAALGVRLFERSPRGVAPTPAGRMLVQRGRELLAEADVLATDLRDWSLGFAGMCACWPMPRPCCSRCRCGWNSSCAATRGSGSTSRSG